MKIGGSIALKLCLSLVAAAAIATPSSTPTLSASPTAVEFPYSPPAPAPAPAYVTLTASNGSSPALSVTIMAGSGTPATLFPTPTVSGDTIQVYFDVTTFNSLAPGIYTATITVSASGFTPLTVPVTLDIGAALAIIPSPASLTFSSPGATVQTVQLLGYGGSAISFSVTSSVSGGGNWLSATANATYTPATLTVTVNPLNVAAGTYQGTVTVTPSPGAALAIPITFQVGANTLAVSPASLAFAYTLAGTAPPAQTVQLTSPLSSDTYIAQAASTGNWLLVNGLTTQISGAIPATLNVTINPSGLTTGTYQGTITATDAESSTQTVAVTLDVGGLSTIANPSSLVFVAQAGGPAPATQNVSVAASPNATWTATVTGTWLSVSSTSGSAPAQLTVSANPTGLAAGTYAGNVLIDLDTHTQNIQVTLVVSANPVLTTTPGELIFAYFGGGTPPSPGALLVGVSSGSPQAFTVASGVPSWLQISSTGTVTTPASISIGLVPQTLATGTYLANIILTPTAAGGVSVVVPVLLSVEGAAPVISTPPSLSFSAAAGGAPQTQTIEVTALSSTPFSASATSTGNWLSVSPTSGTATTTNTPLTVTANAATLADGTYQSNVTLTTAGGVVTQVPVTFTVSAGGATFAIVPTTLSFAYTQNASLPGPQNLQITGTQSFTAVASTTNGEAWLSVTPTSGTGNTTLSVSVPNPATLAPGVYTGSITLTPATGTAQVVPVTLTVSPASSLTATPSPLAFAYSAGNPPPAAQTVSVASTASAVTFTATASSSGWLSVTPAATTTPATLTVSVNPANLAAGAYTGSIALSGGSGTAQLSIPVTLTVAAPLPVISGVVNAASYLPGGVSPGEIVTIFGTSLGPTTGVSATISKGYIPTTLANSGVTFNGYAAPVLYASTGQINAIIPYELAGATNASVEVIYGSARSNSATLAVVSAAPGIFSADASGQGPGAILDVNYNLVSASNPVSAGSAIQIFATGQGQTSPPGMDGLIEPLTLPLPSPLLPAGVTIGGLPADILYVGAAPGLVAGALQVNVVVPAGVASGAAPLFLSFGGVDNSQTGITVAIK